MTEQTEIKQKHPKSAVVKAVLVSLFLVALLLAAGVRNRPIIDAVTAAETLNEDYTVTLTVEARDTGLFKSDEVWCYLGEIPDVAEIPDDAWVRTVDRQAHFDVDAGDYHVFAMDDYGNVSHADTQHVAINQIISIALNYEELYLPLEDTRQFEADLFVLGEVDKTVTWSSSDSSVASIGQDGLLTTHSPGEITVTGATASGLQATADIVVTDLFHKTLWEASKTKLPAYQYTTEEAHVLDAALASRVNEAGFGTRAGPVAAARFITMEFPYLVPYFFENGRMVNHFNRFVDGEGRYYHIGLYLSEDKYDDIVATFVGPAIWGAPLMNFQDEGSFKPGGMYANGLDCSGFVTWVLLNGGFDVGDVGAGDYIYRDDDLCDLGERVPLTLELVESGRIKVGDLIGQDGHIAIIVGMTDEHIYVAESSGPGVRVVKLTWYYEVFNWTYDYVMLMDSVYGEDGNLTEMW